MVREHKRQNKTKYKIPREMNPVENLVVLAWAVLKLFNFLAGGGGSKAPPGLNTIKVVTAKPLLNKSLNQCVFTSRFTRHYFKIAPVSVMAIS